MIVGVWKTVSAHKSQTQKQRRSRSLQHVDTVAARL